MCQTSIDKVKIICISILKFSYIQLLNFIMATEKSINVLNKHIMSNKDIFQ